VTTRVPNPPKATVVCSNHAGRANLINDLSEISRMTSEEGVRRCGYGK